MSECIPLLSSRQLSDCIKIHPQCPSIPPLPVASVVSPPNLYSLPLSPLYYVALWRPFLTCRLPDCPFADCLDDAGETATSSLIPKATRQQNRSGSRILSFLVNLYNAAVPIWILSVTGLHASFPFGFCYHKVSPEACVSDEGLEGLRVWIGPPGQALHVMLLSSQLYN